MATYALLVINANGSIDVSDNGSVTRGMYINVGEHSAAGALVAIQNHQRNTAWVYLGSVTQATGVIVAAFRR